MSHYRDQRNAFYNRAMCLRRAGVYSWDYTDPEPMDLPEVCAFSRYGLLEEIDYRCSEEFIVVQDIRFGTIPVCTIHRKHVIKMEVADEQKETQSRSAPVRQWFGDYGRTPGGTPFYFDSSSGHVIAGGHGWQH